MIVRVKTLQVTLQGEGLKCQQQDFLYFPRIINCLVSL